MTSNMISQAISYPPVCDVGMYRFTFERASGATIRP